FGEFGILPQHTPLFALLGVGKLTLVTGAEKRYFVLANGFVEVSQDQVTILAESCENAKDLDLERARKALAESEQELLKFDDSEKAEYKEHWERVRRARARLEVAELVD